jgi:hypothetical protein
MAFKWDMEFYRLRESSFTKEAGASHARHNQIKLIQSDLSTAINLKALSVKTPHLLGFARQFAVAICNRVFVGQDE